VVDAMGVIPNILSPAIRSGQRSSEAVIRSGHRRRSKVCMYQIPALMMVRSIWTQYYPNATIGRERFALYELLTRVAGHLAQLAGFFHSSHKLLR
jgi:hypothetical protein